MPTACSKRRSKPARNDVTSGSDGHVILTSFEDLNPVARALEEKLGEPETVHAIWKPQTLTPVAGDKAETLMKLIATIEDDDDVQNVYANYDIDEATHGAALGGVVEQGVAAPHPNTGIEMTAAKRMVA